MYFYGFILCEFFNVLVAVSVLFLTNKFLNHSFLLYGLKVKESSKSLMLMLPSGVRVLPTAGGRADLDKKSHVRRLSQNR